MDSKKKTNQGSHVTECHCKSQVCHRGLGVCLSCLVWLAWGIVASLRWLCLSRKPGKKFRSLAFLTHSITVQHVSRKVCSNLRGSNWSGVTERSVHPPLAVGCNRSRQRRLANTAALADHFLVAPCLSPWVSPLQSDFYSFSFFF